MTKVEIEIIHDLKAKAEVSKQKLEILYFELDKLKQKIKWEEDRLSEIKQLTQKIETSNINKNIYTTLEEILSENILIITYKTQKYIKYFKATKDPNIIPQEALDSIKEDNNELNPNTHIIIWEVEEMKWKLLIKENILKYNYVGCF